MNGMAARHPIEPAIHVEGAAIEEPMQPRAPARRPVPESLRSELGPDVGHGADRRLKRHRSNFIG
jgi:hypothetical protein